MKAVIGWTLTLLVTFAAQAHAESVGGLMKDFGLNGVWSSDCTRDINQPFDYRQLTNPANLQSGHPVDVPNRTTFTPSSFGISTITTAIPTTGGGAQTYENEIQSAEQITKDKLKLVYKFGGPSSGVAWAAQPGEIWESVYLKVGDKLRLFSNQRADGQKIGVQGGYVMVAPGGTKLTEVPSNWLRGYETPLIERCLK